MSKNFEFALKDKDLDATHQWYGKEDRTEDTSIHDTGKGEAIVIRMFEFKFRPDLEILPAKEQLLTPDYLKHIKTELWGDGLRMVLEPRVDITKEGCKIFVTCQATSGNSFLDEPKLLQEWTQ